MNNTNNRRILTIPLLAMFILCDTHEGFNMKTKEDAIKAIEALHEKDRAASLAGDIETLLSLFTDDGIVMPDKGNNVQGKAALRKMLEQNLSILETHELIEYKHDFQELKILGDHAFEWGFYQGKYVSKQDHQEISGSGKMMRLLERQKDGTWKVSRSIWTVDE